MYLHPTQKKKNQKQILYFWYILFISLAYITAEENMDLFPVLSAKTLLPANQFHTSINYIHLFWLFHVCFFPLLNGLKSLMDGWLLPLQIYIPISLQWIFWTWDFNISGKQKTDKRWEYNPWNGYIKCLS